MKLCIDPGQGRSNVGRGIFDADATTGEFHEADIALAWALTLEAEALEHGIDVFLTRTNNDTKAPVGSRDDRAALAGCDYFLSIQCTTSPPAAMGVETFYRDGTDAPLASVVQAAALWATGLTNRGVRHEGLTPHGRLAVLDFARPACLVEIGFLTNGNDLQRMLSRDVRMAFASQVIAGLQRMAAQPALVGAGGFVRR